MCKLTLAFSQRHLCVWSHFTPFSSPLLPTNLIPSPRFHGQFYLTHSQRVIINSSQLFMSPFSADSLRNCLFRLLNNCDYYKFTATPCALNMHLGRWPPAAISLSLCLSFAQITQLFSLFHTLCFSRVRGLKQPHASGSQSPL